MSTYAARFAYASEESTHQVEAMDAEDAVLEFAEWAESELDMWEADDRWTDDHSIVVTSPDGSVTRWNIRRYYVARFTARQVYNQ